MLRGLTCKPAYLSFEVWAHLGCILCLQSITSDLASIVQSDECLEGAFRGLLEPVLRQSIG